LPILSHGFKTADASRLVRVGLATAEREVPPEKCFFAPLLDRHPAINAPLLPPTAEERGYALEQEP